MSPLQVCLETDYHLLAQLKKAFTWDWVMLLPQLASGETDRHRDRLIKLDGAFLMKPWLETVNRTGLCLKAVIFTADLE